MGKDTITASNVLAEGLVKSARAKDIKADQGLVPKEYASLGCDEIFERFIVVAPEIKGYLSAAYGSYGNIISGGLTLDFGQLILPGSPLSAGLSLTGSVKLIDEALIIIHCNMPDKLIAASERENIHPSKFIAILPKPITLLALQGHRSGGAWGATLFASVGPPTLPIATIDAFSISLIGAEASFTHDTSVYYFEENTPGWYKQSRDPLLKDDFKNCLGIRHAHYLKREMTLWLKYVRKNLVNKLPNTDNLSGLKTAFKSLPGFSPFWLKASTDDVLSKLESIIDELKEVKDSDFPQENQSDIPGFRARLNEYAAELKQAKTLKEDYVAAEKSPIAATETTNFFPALCHAAITSIKKELTFSIAIGTSTGAYGGTSAFGKKAMEGEGRLAQQSAITIGGPTLSVAVNFTGSRVTTTYRYQNYSLSDRREQRVIFTQDTQIHYKTFRINASTKFAIDFALGRDIDLSGVHAPGLDKAKNAKDLINKPNWGPSRFNAMTYKAVIAFWHFPASGATTVHTHAGSGLAFGFSVRMQTLLQLARDLHNDNESEPAVQSQMQVLAQGLRISKKQLKEFILELISESDLAYATPFKDLTEYGSILLESSFRVKSSEQLNLDRAPNVVQDLTTHTAWKDFFEKENAPIPSMLELECVRLRVRIADHTVNHKRSVFRLGFMIFGVGITVGNDEITDAGNEGIFDLYSHWYKPVDRSEGRRRTTTYRDAVPPVALLPHPFNA